MRIYYRAHEAGEAVLLSEMNEEIKGIFERACSGGKMNPLALVKGYEAVHLREHGEKLLLQTDDPLYQLFIAIAETMNAAKTREEKMAVLSEWSSAIRQEIDRREGEEWKSDS